MALPSYSTPIDSLPSQMLSYKEKMSKRKKWVRDCVDALEQLGRRQYFDNLRFIENYQMLNGKFIPSHYYEQEGYQDMITALSQEFEIPSTLRHYDFINKIINNLTEKLAEFPDIFRVDELFEEGDTNEYVRTQTDLLHKSVKADINQEIISRLLAEGIDPNKNDFASEEEAMQYQKELQDMEQAMQPRQIATYMNTNWQSQGEIWGNHQLKIDKERYRLEEKERDEFRDMLVTDRCFRHFYLTPTGYDQETWNPLNTFFHISPDVNWVEDGDYAGRIFYLTKADIINRYGWKMDTEDIKALETLDREYSNDLDFNGFPYKVYAPFEDFKAYDIIRKNSGYDPIQRLPVLGDEAVFGMTENLPYVDRNAGLFRVTEVYWQSQVKRGKVVYFDPQTGILVKENVDENFIVPEHWEEVNGDFFDGEKSNTVYWTWTDQVWKGIKICFAVKDTDAIYMDLGPADFQFKGDFNPYDSKLPICGRIFNNRNAQSMSLVDLIKPNAVGHNIAMNQLYQLMEKEEGKFMLWSAKMFNTIKDWGGEDGFDKIRLMIKEFGHMVVDDSPQNMATPGGAGLNNTLPREVDMSLTTQILSRAKIAQFFEDKAYAQVGISAQFMADTKASETAEGIKTSVTQTQLNVQRYYTDFFEYKKRCLAMDLDIAQYTQAKRKDVLISYTKSDQSRVFIKMLGTDLLFRNLGIFVMNSQILMKQLEQIKSLFFNQNTMGASKLDYVDVIMANSPAALRAKLAESIEKEQKIQQQQQQAQIQQKQAELEQNIEVENREDNRNAANNETKIQVATIAAGAKAKTPAAPAGSQGPSQLDYNKFNAKTAADTQKADIARQQNEIQQERNTNDKLLKAEEILIKRQKLKSEDKRTSAIIRAEKEKTKRDRKKQ